MNRIPPVAKSDESPATPLPNEPIAGGDPVRLVSPDGSISSNSFATTNVGGAPLSANVTNNNPAVSNPPLHHTLYYANSPYPGQTVSDIKVTIFTSLKDNVPL